MSKAKNKQGFTIVETLIVLAITGVLFVATSIMVRGQIANYLFKDSVDRTQVVVRDVLNDVQTGYYPLITSNTNVNCGVNDTVSSSGSSQKCVIAGKRITFTQDSIVVDTLVVDASNSNPLIPNSTAFKTVSAVSSSTPYPGSVKFAGSFFPNPQTDTQPASVDAVYNILYSSYNPSTASKFTSGSQSVGIYDYSYHLMSGVNNGNGRTLCLSDGSRTGSITIGVAATLDISVRTNDSQC